MTTETIVPDQPEQGNNSPAPSPCDSAPAPEPLIQLPDGRTAPLSALTFCLPGGREVNADELRQEFSDERNADALAATNAAPPIEEQDTPRDHAPAPYFLDVDGNEITEAEYHAGIAALRDKVLAMTPEELADFQAWAAERWQEKHRNLHGPGTYFTVKFGPEETLQHPECPDLRGHYIMRDEQAAPDGCPALVGEGGALRLVIHRPGQQHVIGRAVFVCCEF